MNFLNWIVRMFVLLFVIACWVELHSIRVYIGAPEFTKVDKP